MKCVIADDEYWVRASLASMLMEIDANLEIAGEVSNGAALLDVLEQLQPDVVFVDIRMPRMTGLDCMRAARPKYPEIQWVILSGYSEFDFAREAISLGAIDYLLKPVRRETLEDVLDRVQKAIQERSENQRKLFRHDLYALMYDDYLESHLKDRHFTAYLFGFDGGTDWPDLKKHTEQVRERIQEMFQDMPDTADFMLAGGRYALISYGKDREETITARLQRMIAESRQEHFAMTVCKIGAVQTPEALRDELHRCEHLFALRVVAQVGRMIERNELEAIEQNGHSEIYNMCSDLELLPQRVTPMHVSSVNDEQLENLCSFIRLTTGIEIPSYARNRWLEYLSASTPPVHNADFVAMAKDYIQKNYTMDIGVTQIAEVLQITPNYLSTLFRRIEGTTLIRYLTAVRLDHAKKLLENSQLRISQIAREVGYTDSHYFTRVFKENFGVYPTEYQRGREKK